jgi:hypothetical protein
MLSESDKSADHEMCSSDHGRFHCVRFASVRSVTTALSGESSAAIWRRSDRDRKGFDPTFSKTSACYSAKVRAVSAARRRQSRLRDRSFLTSILSVRCCKISLSGKLFRLAIFGRVVVSAFHKRLWPGRRILENRTRGNDVAVGHD